MELRRHFARHGGAQIEYNAPAEEINAFARQLPAEQRESMYEVLQALSQNGLITVVNEGVFADGEGNIGGSDDC